MKLNLETITFFFKVVLNVILHPIDTYNSYVFIRDNKDKLDQLISEVRPLIGNGWSDELDALLVEKVTTLGLKEDIIKLADYLEKYLLLGVPNSLIDSLIEKYAGEDIDKVNQFKAEVTPEKIEEYKKELNNWLAKLDK